jgi:zinc transport system permease protein
MLEAIQHDFFRQALIAGLLASVACGVIGALVVVKRIASISGGLSHAAFGGVGLAYLLGLAPLLGAAAFAVLCGLVIAWAYRSRRQTLDTLIAMVWSIGMALGIVFVSLKEGYAPDLMSYLFGSILFVPPEHVVLTALLDGLVLAITVLLFKELQAVSFDEEFSEVVGAPVNSMFYLLVVLTALTVVVLIRMVGVILVIALLTIPAATARQWAQNLPRMMAIGVCLSAIYATAGLFLSWWLSIQFQVDLPTGPLIILLAALGYGISSALQMIGE